MSRPQVSVARNGGSVAVRVVEDGHPESIVAAVWQFAPTGERERLAGEIRRTAPLAELGSPAAIGGKAFVVDGFVVPFMSDPPSPYRVVLTVLQDGKVLHREVPPDHGTGTVGKKAVRFGYSFDVEAV
jgi:hypothetical protein